MHNIPIFCDNTSVINTTKNHIQNSRTKHIEIRHYFISDHAFKGDISIEFVDTHNQLADIFTKPLSEVNFTKLEKIKALLMCMMCEHVGVLCNL